MDEILFVDDNGRNMQSYFLTLKDAGYKVIFEESLDKAVSVFNKNPDRFSLIIIDLALPPGDNFFSSFRKLVN